MTVKVPTIADIVANYNFVGFDPETDNHVELCIGLAVLLDGKSYWKSKTCQVYNFSDSSFVTIEYDRDGVPEYIIFD